MGYRPVPTPGRRISYRAPSECPAQEEFLAFISARTPSEVFDVESINIAVELERRGAGYHATLRVLNSAGGSSGERTFTGTTCTAAADAVLVAVTLLLGGDPNETPDRAAPPVDPPPVQPLPIRRVEPPHVEIERPPALRRSKAQDEPVRFALGARLEGVAGLTPNIALGGAIISSLEWRSLAIKFDAQFDATVVPLRFGLQGAGLDVRVIRGTVAGCYALTSVHLCATASGGLVEGAAFGAPTARTGVNGFFAVGARADVLFRPSPSLALVGTLLLEVPILRTEFLVGTMPIAAIGIITGTLAVGVLFDLS